MDNQLISIIEKDACQIVSAVDLAEVKGKSVLITGASGLLGIYFLATMRVLADQGNGPQSVTAVVYSEVMSPLPSLLNFKGARVMQGDLTDLAFVQGLGKFDYVIHAAGYGQPGRFMEDRIKTIKLNTTTTLELFNALMPGGHFLFISTSEVYSGLPNPPYKEDQIGITNTTHLRSCYIEAKRCGEAICNAYRERGYKANSARLALAYGPGTKPNDRRVINSFIERGINQCVITLQDMGVAKRTYCYVSDAVEILFHILLRGTMPVYNVGGLSRTTVANLAQKIGKYLKIPVEFPKEVIELTGAPEDVYLNMELVRKEFEKTEFVSFDDGLSRTIEWQKALYTIVS